MYLPSCCSKLGFLSLKSISEIFKTFPFVLHGREKVIHTVLEWYDIFEWTVPLNCHFIYRFVLLLWFYLDVYFANCFVFSPREGATDSVNMLNQKYTEDFVGLSSFYDCAFMCGTFWIIFKAIINAHIFGLRIWISTLPYVLHFGMQTTVQKFG